MTMVHRLRQESGQGAFLLMTLLLPMFFILVTVLFGVQQVTTAEKKAKRIAESAALQGARYLPHRDTAVQVAHSTIGEYSSAGISFRSAAEQNGILTVTAQVESEIPFSRPLFQLLGKEGSKKRVQQVRASAMKNPLDLVIFLDVGRQAAPLTGTPQMLKVCSGGGPNCALPPRDPRAGVYTGARFDGWGFEADDSADTELEADHDLWPSSKFFFSELNGSALPAASRHTRCHPFGSSAASALLGEVLAPQEISFVVCEIGGGSSAEFCEGVREPKPGSPGEQQWSSCSGASRGSCSICLASARVATQQCFNPTLSTMKEAALRLHDAAAADPNSQVGLVVGPSEVMADNGGVLEKTRVNAFVSKPLGPALEGEKATEATLPFFSSTFGRDEVCLHAAVRAADDPDPVERELFAQPEAWYGSSPHPLSPLDFDENSLLREGRGLTTRDVIWGLAARPYRANIHRAVEAVSFELLSGGSRRAAASKSAHLAEKVGVLLLSEIPNDLSDTFQTIEAKLQSLNGGTPPEDPNALTLTLLFVSPLHAGAYGPWFVEDRDSPECALKLQSDNLDATCDRFFQESAAFQNQIDQLLEAGQPPLRYLRPLFIRVPDAPSLAVEVSSFLPLVRRSVFLVS